MPTSQLSAVAPASSTHASSSLMGRDGKFTRKARVAQFGLGMIGLESVRLLSSKPWVDVVGAVDINPAFAGKRLSEVCDVASVNRRIFSTFEELYEETRPDVILHTAGSRVADTLAQIEPMVKKGVSVVSSCEELLFPQLRAPAASTALDALCVEHNARVVATGVNPGFVMDIVPICATGVSRTVRSIYAERVVNASTRRMMLQKKIGSGMNPAEFRALFAAGKAGHAGFRESAALIAHAMSWPIDKLTETCEPIVADKPITTRFFQVSPGQTCGLHQRCTIESQGRTPLTLDLKMYLDAPNPHDTIRIDGEPSLELTFTSGVAGDDATVAALVNAIPRLLAARPGLLLMTDLSVPRYQ